MRSKRQRRGWFSDGICFTARWRPSSRAGATAPRCSRSQKAEQDGTRAGRHVPRVVHEAHLGFRLVDGPAVRIIGVRRRRRLVVHRHAIQRHHPTDDEVDRKCTPWRWTRYHAPVPSDANGWISAIGRARAIGTRSGVSARARRPSAARSVGGGGGGGRGSSSHHMLSLALMKAHLSSVAMYWVK